MPSYEVCQHCSHSVRTSEAVSREGYSYHKHCQKCYVCSETDLKGAEVFRGVIFCNSCAKRIFRGCSTVRGAKPRAKPRARRHVRARRPVEHSVIERARAASYNSNSASSIDNRPQNRQASSHNSTSSIEFSKAETAVPAREPRISQDCYCVSDVVTQARQLINFIYYQTQNLIKSDRASVEQCTEVCQRMLQDLTSPVSDSRKSMKNLQPKVLTALPQSMKLLRPIPMMMSSTEASTTTSHSRFPSKRKVRKNKKMRKGVDSCNDLRIAELGASVEIATMALRRTSKKKIQSELKITEKTEESKKMAQPETVSMFSNMDTVLSHTSNEEYVDSECEEYRESKEPEKGCVLNNIIIKGMVKTPCQFFRKKILRRSSLISVFVGLKAQKGCESAYQRLKMLFHNDILDHQHSGYKKLYSTINKKKKPFKLGWLEADVSGDRKKTPCKHFHQCHSYRCMRTQVMRLAGPTQSRIHGFRKRLKNVLFLGCLKNVSFQYKAPSVQKPETCGNNDSRVSKSSGANHGQPRSSSSSQGQPRSSSSSQGQRKTSSSSQGQPHTSGCEQSRQRIVKSKWGPPQMV